MVQDVTAVEVYSGDNGNGAAVEVYRPAGQQRPPLDLMIAGWLHSKGKGGQSPRTARAYSDEVEGFRAMLQSAGLDLDGDIGTVALAAQGWCSRAGTHGRRAADDDTAAGQPAASTYNQRLASLSSFYSYAAKMGWLAGNPLARLDRRPVQAYAAAAPVEASAIKRRLAAIDRATPAGLRDYALLAVAVQTGRRLSELAGLTKQDITIQDDGRVLVLWPRAKGGKVMRDILPLATSRVLLQWLDYVQQAAGVILPPAIPVWVSCARYDLDLIAGKLAAGRPASTLALSKMQIARIYKARLGTSRVHATRHTFAHQMEAAGARVSDIQARLGHSSLQTTGRYLAALASADNQHAGQLAEVFGID